MPSFNTAGPCIPGEHYMLPPERRLGRVLDLIEQRKFFTLHAGRQTGKTTSLMWLERHLNASGRCRALWVDLETAREQPDPKRAMKSILAVFDRVVAFQHPDLPRLSQQELDALLNVPQTALLAYLSDLASVDPRPLVVLFDEADGLVGEAMVSFLTQLRHGYIERSRTPFPASVALVGQRQVRVSTTFSFNITAGAMTLSPFIESDVHELLAQHTSTTGQIFQPDAVARIYELGQGDPSLTSAIADQIVRTDVPDRGIAITAAHIDAAKDTIIHEPRAHIDSLLTRLQEPRLRRVLESMVNGKRPSKDVLDDDIECALDLGILRVRGGALEVANPIYRELIPRTLPSA